MACQLYITGQWQMVGTRRMGLMSKVNASGLIVYYVLVQYSGNGTNEKDERFQPNCVPCACTELCV